MITVQNLIYEYPGKRALNDVSFTIEPGHITALVGPNGAGKTTLLRCLSALDEPFSGSVHIDGMDIHEHPREAHSMTGYLSDFFGLYEQLTVQQSLTYMAWSHGIVDEAVQGKIDWALEKLDLLEYRNERANALSRGLRQRLAIAQSILHDPKVLLLDEPASGLDPEARHGLSDLIVSLKNMGMTIIVSSHILAELEHYCTDMLVIRDGAIADHVKLKDVEHSKEIVFEIKVLKKDEGFVTLLENIDGVSTAQFKDAQTLTCHFSGDETAQATLLKTLITKEIPVLRFVSQDKTLQDAYLTLSQNKETSA